MIARRNDMIKTRADNVSRLEVEAAMNELAEVELAVVTGLDNNEFGKIVARLDLITQMLDKRYRRIGLNYAQSLLFLNFLPVQ